MVAWTARTGAQFLLRVANPVDHRLAPSLFSWYIIRRSGHLWSMTNLAVDRIHQIAIDCLLVQERDRVARKIMREQLLKPRDVAAMVP